MVRYKHKTKTTDPQKCFGMVLGLLCFLLFSVKNKPDIESSFVEIIAMQVTKIKLT